MHKCCPGTSRRARPSGPGPFHFLGEPSRTESCFRGLAPARVRCGGGVMDSGFCVRCAGVSVALTPLTEIPQGCSSKFLTLGRV